MLDFTSDYSTSCLGDAVVGDEVMFERAVFAGSFRKPVFVKNEVVKGKIVAESYGKERGQHTFTLMLENGETTRIKGRNLYKNGVLRKRWADENERLAATEEKHARGSVVRVAKRDADYRGRI